MMAGRQELRVLIVSEVYALRERFAEILSSQGYAVTTARNTGEALAVCRQGQTSLMLSDCDSCDSFGVATHHRLRELLGDATPQTILLVRPDVEMAVSSTPMLSKSADPHLSLAMVESLIGIASARQTDPPRHQPRDTLPKLPAAAMESPFGRLVMEALELVATQEIAEAIVADALAEFGATSIPAEKSAFASFAIGPLYRSIENRVGDDAAEAVLEDLQTISGIHSRPALLEAIESEGQPSGVRAPIVSKIVLADDDEHLRNVLGRALRDVGYEVLTAENGREALSLTLRNEPQVLVIDMHIPVLSGRDVCALLKRMRGRAAPAAVLITADETIPDELEAVSTVLRKPVRVHDLVEAIEAAAEEKLANAL